MLHNVSLALICYDLRILVMNFIIAKLHLLHPILTSLFKALVSLFSLVKVNLIVKSALYDHLCIHSVSSHCLSWLELLTVVKSV